MSLMAQVDGIGSVLGSLVTVETRTLCVSGWGHEVEQGMLTSVPKLL